MYTTLEERARAQEKALLRLQSDLVERGLGEGGMELTPVGVPKQETAMVVGRVCCEAAEGRINKASVVLEGRNGMRGIPIQCSLSSSSSALSEPQGTQHTNSSIHPRTSPPSPPSFLPSPPTQGSRRDSGGFRVKLELGELPAFALFPGQVVAVEGVNSSGAPSLPFFSLSFSFSFLPFHLVVESKARSSFLSCSL